MVGSVSALSLDYDTYKNDSSTPTNFNTNLETVFDFDQGTAGSVANKAGGPTGAYNYKPVIAYEKDGNGYGVITTTTNTAMYKENISWNDFTISVDVNTMSAGHLLTLKDSDGDFIYLTSSATTPLTLTYDGVTGSVKSYVNPTTADKTLNWTTITLVRESNVLTLYVDGLSQGSLTEVLSEGEEVASITGLQFANRFTGGNPSAPINATIDNVTLWSRALSAKEVRAFAVPEPTTATLSLLALAGLAARRRRK